MSIPPHSDLSRRERQIMDAVHRNGQGTVSEIMRELPDAPSYSAVRSAMRLLHEKGILDYEHDGKRYVYRPTISRREARESALEHLVRTFFAGSYASTVDALLELSDLELPPEELERLEHALEAARRKADRQ